MGSASMLCSVSSAHAYSALHHEHEFPLLSDSANLHLQAFSLLEDTFNQRSFIPPSSTCNHYDMAGMLPDDNMFLDNPSTSVSPSIAALDIPCMSLDEESSIQARKHPKSKYRRPYLTASQKHMRRNRARALKKVSNTGGVGS